ncbi:MAG: NAD-dependent epimerase/dehydratase family protein [Bacteroidales bacterium]|nr:NAD-dependent epimerase/dehydratase family protein [Bacteroidales bacterium]
MILLLGATGLLGHNVLKLLLQQGRRVRCIIREGSTIDPEVSASAAPGALDIVRGSIMDKQLLMKQMWGCTTVINCAGTTDMTLSSIDDYRPVNTELPSLLARLLYETGGSTLIDISSANTIDPGTAGSPSNEDTPFGGPFSGSLYARSKRESEQALMEFAATHSRLRIVILLPGFMIGPYDTKPSSGQLLLAAYKKPLMAVPPGGKSFIDVRDVASAVVGAIDNQLAQGRYLTTGKAMTLKEFYSLQANVCSYRQLCTVLPRGLCLAAGGLGDKLEARGRKNLIVSRNVRQLLVEEWYDDSKARSELGMSSTPIEQSIRDFFAYYDKHR